MLDERQTRWTADVVGIVTDRFERRLTETTSQLRVDMAQEFAAVRVEMAHGFSAVRQEMAAGLAAVRQEMAQGLAAVRHEMADGRVELLKWMFLFWVGQLFAVASVMAILLRFGRPGAP